MKKINFRILLLVSFVCIALLFSTAIIIQSRPRLEAPATVTTTTATRKYVPPTTTSDGCDSLYFTATKNRGDCKALKGKVLLNFYLVSDGDCVWTDEATEAFRQAAADDIHFMKTDAARFDVDLQFTARFIPVTMPEQMIREDCLLFIPKLVEALGYEDKNEISSALCSQFETDSAAILFCFNRDERSFAHSTAKENGFEFCVLYGPRAFRHELYHLYGARDLYTPDRINSISGRYFPDSVMRVSGSLVVDPLTAFLLGWHDRMDDRVKEFFEVVDR